jgi:hypothetical protein
MNEAMRDLVSSEIPHEASSSSVRAPTGLSARNKLSAGTVAGWVFVSQKLL